MKRRLKKYISVFLSVVMAITVIPTTSYAMEESENDYEFLPDEASIEYEIESKRTKNSKTYVTDDGAYYQVSSAVPIHEEINGEWENITDVNEDVETIEDADELISALADYSQETSNETGFYEDEPLALYTNGTSNPLKIAGSSCTDNGIKSCIYVKPNIISNKTVYINSAKLTVKTGNVDISGNKNIVNVYRLLNALEPPQNVPLPIQNEAPIDSQYATSNNPNCMLDITSYAHYTSLGIYDNTGLALEPYSDQTTIEVDSIVLGIYYREIGDVDSTIESETVNLGRAGSLYINDYSCSPIIVRNDLGIFNELEEVNIQTVINQVALDDDISDGANTRTNYYSTLQFAKSEYYWKDCKGDYIYFFRDSDYKYKGIDSAGDIYVLTCTSNKTDYNNITICNTRNNDEYRFKTINSKGYLVNYSDEYGNTITIDYCENENIISYITDPNGRKYYYNYDSNGMLSSINVFYCKNGEEIPVTINNTTVSIQYTYNGCNLLEEVTYPDGYYVNYEYDDNNRLLEVNSFKNNNGSSINLKKLQLEYIEENSNVNILQRYTLINKGKIVKSIDINSPYGNVHNRVFTNILDGSNKVMQYDSNSNLVHFKDYNEQEYYLNYEDKQLKKLIFAETSSKNLLNNGGFESDSNWMLSNGASITNDAPIKDDNVLNKVLMFTANSNSNSGVTQAVSVEPGNTYVLSCSAYCEDALSFNNDRFFSVKVAGSVSGTVVGQTEFDHSIVGNWQTSKYIIKIPLSISAVKVTINSKNMTGNCYFDDVSLYALTDENTVDVSNTGVISSNEIVRYPNGTIMDIIRKRSGNDTIGKYYQRDNDGYVTVVKDAGKKTYYNYDCTNGLLMSKGRNIDATKNTKYIYSSVGALTAVQQAITTISGELHQNVSYTYDDDQISSIFHNGCLYELSYNDFGKVENIVVKESDSEDSTTDFSISYDYDGENVGSVLFGNGSSIIYTYDGNKITEVIYDNGKSGTEKVKFSYKYTYNDDGTVKQMIDNVTNTVTEYSNGGSTVTRNGNVIFSDNGRRINLFGSSFTYSSSSSTKDGFKTITDSLSASLSYPNVDAETVLDGLDRTKSNSIINKGSTDVNTHYQLKSSVGYVDGINGRQTELVNHFVTEINKRKNILSNKYTNTRMTREWNYNYDDCGRITSVFKKSSSNIDYAPTNNTTYTYDEGNLVHYYQYDEAGQVVLELDLENNRAIRFVYDAGGNITQRIKYGGIGSNTSSNPNYSYDYSTDTLTFTPRSNGTTTNITYKSTGMTDYINTYNGTAINYDKSGNPLNYSGYTINDVNVSGTMTWNGNLLTSFKESNDSYYEYTYDGDGRRTSKTYYLNYGDPNPKSIINYIWDGDTLTGYRALYYGSESGENSDYVLTYDKTIKLVYSDDNLVGASVVANENDSYNDQYSEYFDWDKSLNYTFVRDGKGNITDIYDPSEKVIVHMSYDAYGNMTQDYTGSFIKEIMNQGNSNGSTIGDVMTAIIKAAIISVYVNGIYLSIEQGFDGYIFDRETGLYYRQERYYAPSWGRFINASDPMTLTEDLSSVYNSNLFNYCGNDPVNNISKTGFNAPCTVVNEAIIPQLTNHLTNLFFEDRSTAKSIGEISTGFDILGMELRTTNDSAARTFWDDTFKKSNNTVNNGYGLNYIKSNISKNTSSVSKYSVDINNTPYRTSNTIR